MEGMYGRIRKREKDSVFVIYTVSIAHAVCHTKKRLLYYTEINTYQLTGSSLSQ